MPTSIDPLPGENEFECARCGAIFHYELTRCPNCGVNLYEPEDEDEEKHEPRDRRREEGLAARLRKGLDRLLRRRHPAEELFAASLKQAQLYNDLVRLVGGDREAVERLITFEKRRDPGAGRAAWLASAIRRLQRDSRLSGG